MKVSFSLSSSSKNSSNFTLPSSSPDHNNQSTKKEFITEFDPSKTPIIIPPIPNEWNPNSSVGSITSNIIFGLNIRNKKSSNCDANSKVESESMSAIDRLMLMKLKSDLQRLPDDKGLDEFDDVSVSDFATAYLKGYGWFEGRGIGKNAEEDVKVVEFNNRIGRQGLGFVETDYGHH